MKTKTALLATSALLALSLTVPAQAGNFYVTAMGGVNWQDDNDFRNTTAGGSDTLAISGQGDTGYIIGGAVGMDLHLAMEGLRVELEGALRHNQVDGVYSSFTPTVGGTSGSISYDHRTFSILANAWYDWELGGTTVYAGGGIGWADVEAEGNFGGSPFSVSDSGFAWQLGTGFKFEVSPTVKIGAGYRYFRGPEVTVLAPFAFNAASGELDTETHSVVATVDVRL